MSKFASKQFWLDTLDRSIATFAQAALGAMGAGTVGLIAVNWGAVLSVAGFAALVSVLTSVAFRVPTLEPRENGLGGKAPLL